MTKPENEHALRQNADLRMLVNQFNEFDKRIHSYKPLNGPDNLKLISSFYEVLINAKDTLSTHLKQRVEPSVSFVSNVYKFFFTSEQEKQFGNLSIEDFTRIIHLIDDCDNILKGFYKSIPTMSRTFEVFGSKEAENAKTSSETKQTETNQTPESVRMSPECELTSNGSVRLSPRGRFQIINRLRSPTITSFYDPDTSPVGEFENKFLVFAFQKLADLLNEKVCINNK